MDSAVAADKANIRSFTARLKCFLDKCSRCLLLVPETGATPFNLGLGPYFSAGYGDTIRLDHQKNSCFSVIFQETACPN